MTTEHSLQAILWWRAVTLVSLLKTTLRYVDSGPWLCNRWLWKPFGMAGLMACCIWKRSLFSWRLMPESISVAFGAIFDVSFGQSRNPTQRTALTAWWGMAVIKQKNTWINVYDDAFKTTWIWASMQPRLNRIEIYYAKRTEVIWCAHHYNFL